MVTRSGRLVFTVMLTLIVMGGFFLNERVVAAQGVTDADAIAKVQETRDALAALDSSVFGKRKDQKDLTEKLDKAIKRLEHGYYDKALEYLRMI